MRPSFRVGARALALAACVVTLGACSGAATGDGSVSDEGQLTERPDALRLCAAVRGNGESILTHFASLAHIVEHYGVVTGMAGGSSGSITTFAYESILKNPAVRTCGGAPCSPEADASRVALALKSVEGYAEAVGDSDEAASIKGLVGAVGKLKAEYEARGIDSLDPSEVAEAAKRLEQVLQIPEVRALVNPEVFAMLADTEHLAFNVNEIKTSITQLGAFSADDNRLFFREGVLGWGELASLFGRVGDFYAGYGPADDAGMSAFLDACASKTRDLPWAEAKDVAVDGGETCGSTFTKLVTAYRAEARAAAGTYASRIDERVGDPASPLHKLIGTAVLEGDAVTEYEAALARYQDGEFPSGPVPFSPDFDDVGFGYWGNDADLAKVKDNARGFDDLKSRKFSSLGDVTWREILSASPAEPGLSRFVRLADGRYSAGGWSDLAPALVLKNLGCEQVVYVTRRGDESKFAVGVAKNLGMQERDWSALYDLANPDSSYARSVAAADGVWCTSWDAFTDAQMSAEVLDAYGAPLETRASFARASSLSPYDGATSRVGQPGCTPGLSGGATFPR